MSHYISFEGLTVINPNDFDFNTDPMPLYRITGTCLEEVLVWANHTMGDAEDEYIDYVGDGPDPEDEEGSSDSWRDNLRTVEVRDVDFIERCRDACLAWRNRL